MKAEIKKAVDQHRKAEFMKASFPALSLKTMSLKKTTTSSQPPKRVTAPPKQQQCGPEIGNPPLDNFDNEQVARR